MMNIDNINKLADFLDTLPGERFNMDYWASYNDDGHYEFSESLDVNDCGTAGCIAGWALTFMYDGPITLVTDYDLYEFSKENFHTLNGGIAHVEYVPETAAEWLGLRMFEADKLFYTHTSDSLWNIYADDYGLNKDCFNDPYKTDEPVTSNKNIIHPKHAADMLRRIANGEIHFDDEWSF